MVFKVVIGVAAVGLLVAGFIGWRMDVELPWFATHWYFLGGVALGIAVVWGKIMAPFVFFGSLVPIGYALVVLLLDKSSSWSSVDGWRWLMYTGIGIGVSAILWLSGSETVLDSSIAASRHAARPVYCDLCGHYLGTAGNFVMPCPKCGHNVYTIGEN